MADNRLTRQQIYDRIRESSKDEFILEEMKRLGFWGSGQGDPSVPEVLIKQETALSREINRLLDEQAKYRNKLAALKEMRLKRMAIARQKREENKRKRELHRQEKAQAWKLRKAIEIFYLGEHVSAGLHNHESTLPKHPGLPFFQDESALVHAIGITISELKFLSFSRNVSAVNHYRKFFISKKSGGRRLISAPMPRLRKLQYWILENILNKVAIHPAANGFTTNRSIITNAEQHIAKDVVINADVKDFFPSIHFRRVKGMFQKLGYREKVAVILALVCTEPDTDEVKIDGRTYFVRKGARVLPQGAATSPAITNILCYRLDKRLQGIANKYNFSYTRYADDISFSGNEDAITAEAITWRIKKTLRDEGFEPHPEKIRVMRKGRRQEVTGVVVNKKLSVGRDKLRQFRAYLHTVRTKGADKATWKNDSSVSAVTGYLNYIKMVDPKAGEKFQRELNELFRLQKLNGPVVQPKRSPDPQNTPSGNDPGKGETDTEKGNWWRVV